MEISKKYIKEITGIILAMLLFGMNQMIGVLVIYCMVVYCVKSNNEFSLLYFTVFSFFQNILLILFANHIQASWMTIFMLSKEVMIYGCLVINFLKKKKIQRYELLFISFGILLMESFIISDGEVYAKILTIRQMLLPFVCYFFGKEISLNNDSIRKIVKIIIYASLVTAVLGFIEFFVLGDMIWLKLPLQKYQENKKTVFELYNGVPLNFYTWDYYWIINRVVRRLVSLFADPLITGHYLLLGAILAKNYIRKRNKKIIICIVLLVAALLTLSKGVYISVLIFIFMYLLRNMKYLDIKIICSLVIMIIIGGFGFIYNFVVRYMNTSSVVIHMNGLLEGIENLSLFGYGIGKAGVITAKVGEISENLAAESYIGVLAVQLGSVGTIFFVGFFVIIAFKLIKKYKNTHKIIFLDSACLVIAVIVEAFFSESSIGIIATGMYFVFAGLFMNKKLCLE